METEHFRVITHQNDSLAYRVAQIAEDKYRMLTRDFEIEWSKRTPIVVLDTDDIANGYANPLDHAIVIWTTGAVKETPDSLGWLDRVTGHELTHMVTFWSARNCFGKPWELMTLGLTPIWYLEGVAQTEAEHWDTHRDLLLRSAFRSGAVHPPKRLDGFIGSDRFDGRLIYEEGHALSRFISEAYGRDTLLQIIKKHKQFPLIPFSWTVKQVTGERVGPLFNAWKEETEGHYRSERQGRETAENFGAAIPIPLEVVHGIRYSSRNQPAVVGQETWDEGVSRLYVQNPQNSKWEIFGGPHVGANVAWSPDGNTLIISRKHRGSHGSILHDLFLVDIQTKKETWLTRDARATDPAWSPDGSALAFVKRHAEGSALWIWDFNTGKLSPITPTLDGQEVFSPSWSPDSRMIAFSLVTQHGKREIAMTGREGDHSRILTDNDFDDRSPIWAKDGKSIVFCSAENGTPNLCRIAVDSLEKIWLTDVAGGVFNPAFSTSGDSISFVLFEERDRVRAYSIPADRALLPPEKISFPAWAASEISPGASVPVRFETPIQRYSAIQSICPHLVLPFMNMDEKGNQWGIIGYASDPLYHHEILAWLTAGSARTDFYLSHTYAGFEPLVTTQIWNRSLSRGDYLRVGQQDLWEHRTGVSLSFAWPFNRGRDMLSNHWISIFMQAEEIRPVEWIEPAVEWLKPFNGLEAFLGFRYAWSKEQPTVGMDIHPKNGTAFSASFIHADPVWGSDLKYSQWHSVLSKRKVIPWADHVLAAKISGFSVWGDTPIQDRYSLSSPYGIRALPHRIDGDRWGILSVEYRVPLIHDLGLKIPLFYFERFTLAGWNDYTTVWGTTLSTYQNGKRRSFDEAEEVWTSGVELRSRSYFLGKLAFVVRTGWGRQINHSDNGEFYWMVGGVF